MCVNNVFGIECSLVIKYLSITDSKQFYKRLRDSYEPEIDFVIKRKMVEHSMNSLKNTYHITFDCFEKLCLASKSVKGAEVRDYVIIVNKIY